MGNLHVNIMEKLFVQFYIPSFDKKRQKSLTLLCNGLSTVWDEAQPIWINGICPLPPETRKLFEESKEIYVSVWYIPELSRIVKWARAWPEINFIIGGPIAPYFSQAKELFPKNVHMHYGLAEALFNRHYDLSKWKITAPSDVPGYIVYGYFLRETCYWNKCTFCGPGTHGFCFGEEDRWEVSLKPLETAPEGVVYLSSPSLAPSELCILKNIPLTNNKKYGFYIRAEECVYQVLKDILPQLTDPKRFIFRIGVEFPSNRMLQKMNKGVTVKEIIQVVNLLEEYECRKTLFYIIGWQDLVKEDLIEAQRYFETLLDKEDVKTTHCISQLKRYYAIPEKTINDTFRISYKEPLTSGDAELNKEWLTLLESRPGARDIRIAPAVGRSKEDFV